MTNKRQYETAPKLQDFYKKYDSLTNKEMIERSILFYSIDADYDNSDASVFSVENLKNIVAKLESDQVSTFSMSNFKRDGEKITFFYESSITKDEWSKKEFDKALYIYKQEELEESDDCS